MDCMDCHGFRFIFPPIKAFKHPRCVKTILARACCCWFCSIWSVAVGPKLLIHQLWETYSRISLGNMVRNKCSQKNHSLQPFSCHNCLLQSLFSHTSWNLHPKFLHLMLHQVFLQFQRPAEPGKGTGTPKPKPKGEKPKPPKGEKPKGDITWLVWGPKKTRRSGSFGSVFELIFCFFLLLNSKFNFMLVKKFWMTFFWKPQRPTWKPAGASRSIDSLKENQQITIVSEKQPRQSYKVAGTTWEQHGTHII